jgi:NADH dehydrogenase FAD-containing subunit
MTEHAVVIAGGGPTGMMLGAELAPESVMPQAQPATAVQRGTATPKASR